MKGGLRMKKYKIGEKVKVSNRLTVRKYNSACGNPKSYYFVCREQQNLGGEILTIKNIDAEGDYLVNENDYQWTDEMLVSVDDKNEDDLVRYMVYGTGCDNKSKLVENEEELKNMLKSASKSGEWTGKILGYKLVPLYQAEEITTLKFFTKTKVTKK